MSATKDKPHLLDDFTISQQEIESAAAVDVFQVSGKIKWFDASKGYGFIVPENG
ncbi:MAG: cold-shock protein, partial [Alphaproteobacteria bacterium]